MGFTGSMAATDAALAGEDAFAISSAAAAETAATTAADTAAISGMAAGNIGALNTAVDLSAMSSEEISQIGTTLAEAGWQPADIAAMSANGITVPDMTTLATVGWSSGSISEALSAGLGVSDMTALGNAAWTGDAFSAAVANGVPADVITSAAANGVGPETQVVVDASGTTDSFGNLIAGGDAGIGGELTPQQVLQNMGINITDNGTLADPLASDAVTPMAATTGTGTIPTTSLGPSMSQAATDVAPATTGTTAGDSSSLGQFLSTGGSNAPVSPNGLLDFNGDVIPATTAAGSSGGSTLSQIASALGIGNSANSLASSGSSGGTGSTLSGLGALAQAGVAAAGLASGPSSSTTGVNQVNSIPSNYVTSAAMNAINGIENLPNAYAGTQPIASNILSGYMSDPYAAGVQSSANAAGQQLATVGAQDAAASANDYAAAGMLAPAAAQVLGTAFDPQQALYNRTLQQTTDQINAQNAAMGLGSSPAGAGLTDQAVSNFNIDWQNQQLARQTSGLQAASAGLTSMGQDYTTASALGTTGAGVTANSGQLPYQAYTGLLGDLSTALGSYQPYATGYDAVAQQGVQDYLQYMGQGTSATNAANNAAQTNYTNSTAATNAYNTNIGNLLSAAPTSANSLSNLATTISGW